MPKFLIERDMPNVGNLTPQELTAASQTSCAAIRHIGPDIQWVHSYVTPNKIYCIYIAANEDVIRRHANEAGFPANVITPIKAVIDPTTAEG
jgi:hypothetical protein